MKNEVLIKEFQSKINDLLLRGVITEKFAKELTQSRNLDLKTIKGKTLFAVLEKDYILSDEEKEEYNNFFIGFAKVAKSEGIIVSEENLLKQKIAPLIESIIRAEVEKRKILEIAALENKPATELAESLARIENEAKLEMALFDLTEIDIFYEAFNENWIAIDPKLQMPHIKEMFIDFVKEIYAIKVKLLDSASGDKMGAFVNVPHEGINRVIWSPALQTEIEDLRKRLDSIFAPLLMAKRTPKKTALFREEGSARVREMGLGIQDNPLIVFHAKLQAKAYKVFIPDKRADLKNIETALNHIIWSALSQQYMTP